MVRLQVIDHWSRLDSLQPEWDPFLDAAGTDNLFLSWDYLHCWREIFGPSFQPRVLVARDGEGVLLGLAPLMIGPGHRSLRRFVRHLAFLGQLCESLSEYCDFVLRPGFEAEVMEAFYAQITGDLASEWDVLYFPLIPADSPSYALLRGMLRRDGSEPKAIFTQQAHFAALPGSWEEYLASRSSNFRDKLRKGRNRLIKNHEVRMVRAGSDISLDEAMPLLGSLVRERWEGNAEAFCTERFDQFHRLLARRFAARGRLALWFLLADGEAAAAEYDFIDPVRRRVYGFQAGWRREFGKFSVGKLLQAHCFQMFIAQGMKEYDFLSGHGEYKASWGTGERQLCDLEVPNPGSVRGRVFGLARRFREARSNHAKARSAA